MPDPRIPRLRGKGNTKYPPRCASRAAAGWDERGASGELVVVNDGSADRTGAIADELAAKDPRVRAVHHPTNRGMGAVIRSGYAASTGRYVTQLPADAQVGPDTLEGLLPLLDEAETVLSVYRARDDGKKRALMSFVFQGLVRVLFGHDGRITGTMILRRELVERFPIKSNTFFANLELPFRIMDAGVETRVTEIEARPRRSGESKVARPGRILRVVRELVRIRLQEW